MLEGGGRLERIAGLGRLRRIAGIGDQWMVDGGLETENLARSTLGEVGGYYPQGTTG